MYFNFGETTLFMKYLLTITLLVISLNSHAGAIVTFDAQQALLQTDYAKQKFAELNKRPAYAKLVTDAEKLRADIIAANKDANANGMTWTDQQRMDHRKKLEYFQADLKLAAQKIQAEQNTVINSVISELQPKLEKALTAYMEKRDIDMILRKEAAFITKPAADITKDIVLEVNKIE